MSVRENPDSIQAVSFFVRIQALVYLFHPRRTGYIWNIQATNTALAVPRFLY
jgi:hypothetical protein